MTEYKKKEREQKELLKGDVIEIEIEDMSPEGKGIGRFNGMAFFVGGAVPGDTVKCRVTKLKKNYGFAMTEEIVKQSPFRVESPCPYRNGNKGRCGGCMLMDLSYEGQLELKSRQVRDKLIRLGGIENPCMEDIIPMDYMFRYRNKGTFPVSTGGLITRKGGIVEPVHEPRIGFYENKSHDVVNADDCLLQSEAAVAAADALRSFMSEDNITSYDERWDKGLFRSMVVRTAFGTGEVMVILSVNGKGIPNHGKLINMLDEAIASIPVKSDGPDAGIEYSLESVILNVNKGKSAGIPGDEFITLAGKPVITEQIGNIRYEISPASFYQVNPVQMKKLYDKVREYCALTGKETVLDLYCGVGSIGLSCADKAERIIGIESVKEAVIDANRNSVINGIVNTRYICGKAEEELPKLGIKADVAIIDPPRAGCREELLEAVAESEADRIVYVSCDPATLARDIKKLTSLGYDFVKATPCDMFGFTHHIETVALLRKGNA